MTLAPEGHASRGGLRFGGALLTLILAVAACGSSVPSPATSPGPIVSPAPTTASAPSATAVTTPSATVPSVAPSPTPLPPAGDLLAAALEPLRAASSFETSVTVDGAVVVSATGRSVGAASEMSVTTGTSTVEYLRVPPKAWAREPGGTWVSVDAGAAPGAPLDTLSTPATLVVGGSDAGVTTFTATYPAATLGLKGDPVTVTITADGEGVSFAYETKASGRTMLSTTTLRPSAGDPIVAPA